jgi:hypothetical protein
MVNANGIYLRGNNYQRVQTPPYYRANTKPFWPSLPMETVLTIAAADPLNITTPKVVVPQVPRLLVTAPENGLFVSSIFAKYTGEQNRANALFGYSRVGLPFYCLGAIVLAVSEDSAPAPALALPPILLDTGEAKKALRLQEGESLYIGIAQSLTTPIEVHLRGQLYTPIEKVSGG